MMENQASVALTPEQMRERILELTIPVRDFCREHKIASFSLDDGPRAGDHGRDTTMSINSMTRPLPPRIKCVLKEYGCIYLIDDAGEGGS